MAVLQRRFRKIPLLNLAGDELSDDDSVNCSEISAVTWFGILKLLYFSHRPNKKVIAIKQLKEAL